MKKKPYSAKPFLAPLVLPAVYDDVLSYEEWLSKVIYRLNELSDYITEQLEDVDKLVEDKVNTMSAQLRQYIDESIRAVNIAIDSLEQRVNDLDGKIDSETTRIMRYVDAKAAEIYDRILSLETEFDSKVYDFFLRNKQYTDNKFNEERIARRADIKVLNDRLDNFSHEFPLVYCPALGVYESVQEAIVDVWSSLRYFGLTAKEYDTFDFTAQAYDDLIFQAFEYDVYAGYILKDHIRQMFNPFTGRNENVRDVVAYIADLLKWNGKSASEYDALDYTAGEFDASTYSAYPQDTSKYYTAPEVDYKNKFFKSMLKVFEMPSGTVSQDSISFTFSKTGYKGLSLIMQPVPDEAMEQIDLDGVGSFDISNAYGTRTVVISESGDNITVTIGANDMSGSDVNTYNLVIAAYRRGSSYDVTQLDA